MKTIIESAQNKFFKLYYSLLSSKGLKSEGLFILSGEKLVQECLLTHSQNIVAELAPTKSQWISRCPNRLCFNAELFQRLDELGTQFNLLVMKQPELHVWSGDNSGLTVLCPLGDPSNVGALIRSAEAFGASRLVLLKESANPFLPKAVKASSGSVLRLPLFKGPSISKLPENKNYVILDKNGHNLKDWKWPSSPILIIGEEGRGIPDSIVGQRISIPIKNIESLNATVAGSIALYDWQQKSCTTAC